MFQCFKNILDPIIPESVLCQSCAMYCSLAYLSDPLFQIIPSAQEWAVLKILSLLKIHTRSHHTRASLRSVMFQALLSSISLRPPISDHPISPGQAHLRSVVCQALLSCMSLRPPRLDHPISPGTSGLSSQALVEATMADTESFTLAFNTPPSLTWIRAIVIKAKEQCGELKKFTAPMVKR